jgi:hypothetical protein
MTSFTFAASVYPIRGLLDRAASAKGGHKLILVDTSFDVRIEAGLALVSTRRVFRNPEEHGIEATITFPLPVHAVLYGLEARIEGRRLVARSQGRSAARIDYEGALERGKLAVLHEEVLRGVHMLSIAQLPPGAEVEVLTTWTMPLACQGHARVLHIPLTVGDIYGDSQLIDADDLVHGGPAAAADLHVRCDAGAILLWGHPLQDGRARVPLNRPIELAVSGQASRTLKGALANESVVEVTFEPVPVSDARLDLAILVDRSGSMDQLSTSEGEMTKHDAVVRAVARLEDELRERDCLDLWEFSSSARRVGIRRGRADADSPKIRKGRSAHLADELTEPAGGTEIGAALDQLISQSSTPNILLITDGKSHALDVHALARKQRRISVLLIGEDSLEANVGHLAVLTGGDIHVTRGERIADELLSACRSFGASAGALSNALPAGTYRAVQGGVVAIARVCDDTGHSDDPQLARAVGAFAASLMMTGLDEPAAEALAVREGLVGHLTSLVLVDEAGAALVGLPASHKIPLPSPASLESPSFCAAESVRIFACVETRSETHLRPAASSIDAAPKRDGIGRRLLSMMQPRRPIPAPESGTGLLDMARAIDWDLEAARLAAGDLTGLEPAVREWIEAMAARHSIQRCADEAGIEPVRIVVALLGRLVERDNRSAKRVADRVLRALPSDIVRAVSAEMGFG